eukprot:10011081-Ditylum_brightwellii.AAC.1
MQTRLILHDGKSDDYPGEYPVGYGGKKLQNTMEGAQGQERRKCIGMWMIPLAYIVNQELEVDPGVAPAIAAGQPYSCLLYTSPSPRDPKTS